MAPASNRDVQRHLESVEYPSSRRIWSQASTRRAGGYSASFGTGLSILGDVRRRSVKVSKDMRYVSGLLGERSWPVTRTGFGFYEIDAWGERLTGASSPSAARSPAWQNAIRPTPLMLCPTSSFAVDSGF
jgi:hypothetical protein